MEEQNKNESDERRKNRYENRRLPMKKSAVFKYKTKRRGKGSKVADVK